MKVQSLHDNLANFLWKQGVPIPMIGDVRMVLPNGTNSNEYWRNLAPASRQFPTITDANNEIQSLQNDTVLITPEDHSLAAALTISKNGTHWIGASAGKMNMRSRVGMGAAFSPMITVSGYGNTFHNLYTKHGTAAADYVGWAISGARNGFYNVHFGGPMEAAQGGHASYEGITIDGSENYFKDCVIGTDTIGRDEASPNVTLGAETLTIFENCIFLANLTDGDPVFIKVENTAGYTWALFKACTFMAFNSNYATPMTKAIECTSGSSCALVFDPLCTFQNVTALSDAIDDSFVWYPTTFSTTTDTAALISAKLSV